MLTLQEIFDKSANHLRRQGRVSAEPAGGGRRACLYRGPDGASCAVGCLFPDNVYDRAFDGAGASSVGDLKDDARFVAALAAGGVNIGDDEVLYLLMRLQPAHDDLSEARPGRTYAQGLEVNLMGVARRCELTYTKPGAST